MNRTLPFLLLSFISIAVFAPKKIANITYDAITKDVASFVEKDNYAEIVEAYNKIFVNDSAYGDALASKTYYLLKLKKYDEAIFRSR
ncbi:hypothetical protein [Aquimarina agarivorans]|uniref:hypothetical protein n=1 Tax=Aquimarina agarivorans TaxID=980584 RepID=UPI000248FC8D|nr:hypothetical protein [Aquimarina agarivorans]